MRAMARLMMSAQVPWIGALIAARSAPPRIAGSGRPDVRGEMRLPAEQGLREAVSARTLQRVGDVGADAGEALEIAGDRSPAPSSARDLQPRGEAPARDAVEDREVDRLGPAARVAVDLAEQLLRGHVVDVVAALRTLP